MTRAIRVVWPDDTVHTVDACATHAALAEQQGIVVDDLPWAWPRTPPATYQVAFEAEEAKPKSTTGGAETAPSHPSTITTTQETTMARPVPPPMPVLREHLDPAFCRIKGCQRGPATRGCCLRHYNAIRRHFRDHQDTLLESLKKGEVSADPAPVAAEDALPVVDAGTPAPAVEAPNATRQLCTVDNLHRARLGGRIWELSPLYPGRIIRLQLDPKIEEGARAFCPETGEEFELFEITRYSTWCGEPVHPDGLVPDDPLAATFAENVRTDPRALRDIVRDSAAELAEINRALDAYGAPPAAPGDTMATATRVEWLGKNGRILTGPELIAAAQKAAPAPAISEAELLERCRSLRTAQEIERGQFDLELHPGGLILPASTLEGAPSIQDLIRRHAQELRRFALTGQRADVVEPAGTTR